MRVIAALIALGAPLWMIACSARDPVADNVAKANPAMSNLTASSPKDQPGSTTAEASTASSPAGAIPVALRGRWGLTPGDCTSTRGDAKGLLVVTANELKFYESRAVPSPAAEATEDSITGNFAFTGEGQSWTKFEKIELEKTGLVRTESNPSTSYSYAKC